MVWPRMVRSDPRKEGGAKVNVGSRFPILVVLLLVGSGLRAQEYPYIAADFHHRYVEVPLDHWSPTQGTFTLYYELSSNFDFDKQTVFYIVDSQQYAHGADRTAGEYRFSDSLNLVLIEYRGRRHSPIDMTRADGSVDWEKAYRLLASHQAVEDIEAVRRDLFAEHPDTKISLYGRSGGAYLIHEYLSRYPTSAARAFTRAAPNPLVMHMQGNPESKFLVQSLDEIDPALNGKLRTVLERESVSNIDLLWLLLQLPYRDPSARELQASMINELYEHNTTTYDEYRAKPGYALSNERRAEVVQQMGVGSLLRILECDGPYLLGPQPDYVDPIYVTMRYLSAPYISLIAEERVPPLEYPSLESFRNVETQVFNLAGKNDHMSPWSIAVELANWFPNYRYFISDDTHTMSEHPECYPPLRNAFLLHGLDSAELEEAMRSPRCVEWRPDLDSGGQ